MNFFTKRWFNNATSRVFGSKISHYCSFEGTPHRVNNLERKFLVWTGKFKKIEEVPDFVSQGTMERCRNLMRIKIANYMMAATALGCLAMVYLGKQAAKRGDTLAKQNLEWHQQMQQDLYNDKKD